MITTPKTVHTERPRKSRSASGARTPKNHPKQQPRKTVNGKSYRKAPVERIKQLRSLIPRIALPAQASKQVAEVMRAIVFPNESPPVRNPVGTSIPTTVYRPPLLMNTEFTQLVSAEYSSVYGTGDYSGMSTIIITDDPLHAYYYTLRTAEERFYTLVFNSIGGDFQPTLGHAWIPDSYGTSGYATSLPVPLQVVYLDPGGPAALSEIPQHIFAYSTGGRNGVLVNGSPAHASVFKFTWPTGTVVPDGCRISLLRLNATGWTEVDHADKGTGHTAIHINVTKSGLFAFEFTFSESANVQGFYMSATLTEYNDALISQPVPGLTARMDSLSSIIVNSASVLCSARSAVIQRGGEIVARQFPSASDPWETLSLDDLMTFQGTVPLDAQNGIYAFLKPIGRVAETFEQIFIRHGSSTSKIAAIRCTSPHPPGGFLTIAFKMPMIDGNYPGAQFSTLLCFGVECVNVDTWSDPEYSTISPTNYLDAFSQLRHVPNIYENPTHWRDLGRAIGRAAGKAISYAPSLLTAMSKILPHIAQASAWMSAL